MCTTFSISVKKGEHVCFHFLSIYEKNKGYLQTQIGNPEGADKPNKKKYDPRVVLREGEKTLIARLQQAFEDLNCIDRL